MKKKLGQTEIVIGNFHGHCCETMLRLWLLAQNIPFRKIKGNSLFLSTSIWEKNQESITEFLQGIGLYIVTKPQEKITELIIAEVHNLVFLTGYSSSMVNNSDHLVEKLGLSYQRLSTVFKKEKNITLEKYIIGQKIERVKQLLLQEELSLSEIAYMMGYSSVQYLSTQFKAITGISVSDYKSSAGKH